MVTSIALLLTDKDEYTVLQDLQKYTYKTLKIRYYYIL